MVSGRQAAPPAGFLDFCARNPGDCGLTLANATGPGPAQPAAVQTVAYAAPARPPRGSYDWSQAFAASRAQAPADGQVAALRQELYGRYMWKAAFASAGAPQPAMMTAALAPSAPAAADAFPTPVLQSASLYDAGLSRSAIWGARAPQMRSAYLDAPTSAPSGEAQGYLIKASFVTLSETNGWKRFQDEEVDPRLADAPAPPSQSPAPQPVQPVETAAAGPQPLNLTPALMAELNAVDRRINGAIIQTADARAYGQDDYWATPLEDAAVDGRRPRGDCEDYALEKRRALIAMGLPSSVLSIAVADTRFGPHAVLLVDTDQGELVLDSLTGKVAGWTATGYHWVKRQAWGDPMTWIEIGQ